MRIRQLAESKSRNCIGATVSLPQLWFDFGLRLSSVECPHHPEPAEGKLGASSQSSEAKPRTAPMSIGTGAGVSQQQSPYTLQTLCIVSYRRQVKTMENKPFFSIIIPTLNEAAT